MQNLGNGNPQLNSDNPAEFRYGEAGGRLRLVDGLKLEYAAFTSSIINVNDVNVAVGAVGAETLLCNSSDETIDLNGAETGVAPSSDLKYYAYVYNGADASAPRVRLSLQPPADYRGFPYLNTSGGGVNWRYLGLVALTGGTPNFRDDDTARLVSNYYNRQRKSLFTCPGYNNNNADTTLTLASGTTFAALNGGTGDSLMLLANGADDVELFASVAVSASAGANWKVAIGLSTSLANARTVDQVACAPCRNTQGNQPSNCQFHGTPLLDLWWASLNAWTNSSAPSVYADMARNGSTADIPATILSGSVMG